MSFVKSIRRLIGIKTQSETWSETAGLTKGDDNMNKIKVGDKVKVVKTWVGYQPYDVGDTLTVTGVDFHGIITHTKEYGRYYILASEVEVIKQDEEAGDDMQTIKINDVEYQLVEVKEVKEETLKEGDYVVCKNCHDALYMYTGCEMQLGKVTLKTKRIFDIEITIISHKNFDVEGKKNMQVMSSDFRKATEEEIEEHKNGNPIHKNKIKVGDYVKNERGYFYEVVEISDHSTYLPWGLTAKHLRSGSRYQIPLKFVTKVELTERELSFIRAGREINEVKKGDIISSVIGIGVSLINTKDGIITTLICPVDKRTDI